MEFNYEVYWVNLNFRFWSGKLWVNYVSNCSYKRLRRLQKPQEMLKHPNLGDTSLRNKNKWLMGNFRRTSAFSSFYLVAKMAKASKLITLTILHSILLKFHSLNAFCKLLKYIYDKKFFTLMEKLFFNINEECCRKNA